MHSTLSPSKFMLVRQDTGRSSIPSQISETIEVPTPQQESEQKTKFLLSKTLKFLNQSHDLLSFSKKIVVPKVRRNTFLQQMDQKRLDEKRQKFLKSRKNKAYEIANLKSTIQQDFQGDFANKNPDKQHNSILKSKAKKRAKNLRNQTSISLSKIQMLSNMQKEQTIAEENYDNQNYIFINLKKAGESESLKEEDQPVLFPSQVPFQPKLRYQKSYLCEMPSLIRPKVKSMSKYDRQHQQSLEKSMDYRYGLSKKGPFTTTNLMNSTAQEPFVSPFIKLLPIIQNKSQNQTQSNQTQNDNIGNIFASLKSIILGPQSTSSKYPQPSNYTTIKDSQAFSQQLKQIVFYYQKFTQQPQTEECLYTLLSAISKDKNKDTIRIYKDDFQKIYVYRYGKDRITTFFDYEYIEDYGSLLSLFQQKILKLTQQQVLLMSFMMLDFDNDGLVSHSDLFRLLEVIDKNRLVKKTIYRVLMYVKEMGKDQAIRDVCQEEYLKKENFTLKKYQFMVYMKDKKKGEGEESSIKNSPRRKNSSQQIETKQFHRNTSRKRQHKSPLQRYFWMKPDTQQTSTQFSFLKSFIDSMTKSQQPSAGHFWINFQRFKTLYPSSVPEIYYDMLYAAFGLKMPGIEYDELDYETPLIKPKKVIQVEEVNEMDVMKERIAKMRATRRDLNGKLIKPDVKRHRKIMTMLE